MLGRIAVAVCLVTPLATHAQSDAPQIAACHQLSTSEMSNCFDRLMKV
jgi:hypothetical protein